MADLQYVLEVEPLDLGADVKAVGLDLVEMESANLRAARMLRACGRQRSARCREPNPGRSIFSRTSIACAITAAGAASRLKKKPPAIRW